MLRHPEVRQRLAADDTLWPPSRSSCATTGRWPNATWRFTTEAVRVGDVTIPEGEFVTIALGAAGRDPGRHQDPDALDIDRDNAAGLAFGHGIHHCLGAPLARLEGRIVLSRLFSRLPGLRLAVPPEQPRWRASLMMRGMEELPVHPS
ncbi:cytochrome P450 [Streptomyces sp. NBC_01190]|uniref:cytochrome P450 n=1 Tax=Streptomyces sp. NBC_01190 TaxID=2903767 RepID=UPI0038692EFA|nr:cytochrome P450 [Streptomyces sp. NBC_01190]